MIDWDMIDEKYGQNFENKDAGQEALSAQVAFGSLYIQRRLGFTDREPVEQIAENPYMQFFIGYKEYRNEKPFDPSLLVTFRKRLPEETMNRIIEKLFIQEAAPNDKHDDKEDPDGDDNPGGDGSGGGDSPNNTQKADELPNRGTLILDATCTPADITFPTDLELCDRVRRWTEIILDHCWALYGSINGKERSPGHTAK